MYMVKIYLTHLMYHVMALLEENELVYLKYIYTIITTRGK